LIYLKSSDLVVQRFNPRALRLVGEPVSIGDAPAGSIYSGARAVSVSANGILVHPNSSVPNTKLVWLDRLGRPVGEIAAPPGRYQSIRISPDGQRIAAERPNSPTESDLWIIEVPRGNASRLTLGAGQNTAPLWSADGSRIVFDTNREGPRDIYVKNVNGTTPEEPLVQSSILFKNLSDWSPDGRYVIYQQLDANTGWDIWYIPMDGNPNPLPYLQTPFNELSGAVSPDGHWIAYASDESGRYEVYVRSFPAPGSKYQVSTGGGLGATWLDRGREILYVGSDGLTVMAVGVQAGAKIEIGTPRALFKLRKDAVAFDIARDGQRLLVSVPAGNLSPATLTLVVNWPAALKH
jgi:Tol biopolymer transport system component